MIVPYLMLMFGFFIIPFAIFKLWFWFWFAMTVGIVFGIWEYTAWEKGGTLSIRFKNADKKVKTIITICMVVFWGMLLAHLWGFLNG